MSKLADQIMTDIKEAMKAKDQVSLPVLRALKSAVQMATIEKYGADGELGEGEFLAVVRKQIKQRQDSVTSFRDGGREELAAKEEVEIGILEKYLPEPLSGDEVEKLVEEVIAETGATTKKEMGQVMKLLQERAAGRADGKLLSQLVGKKLS